MGGQASGRIVQNQIVTAEAVGTVKSALTFVIKKFERPFVRAAIGSHKMTLYSYLNMDHLAIRSPMYVHGERQLIHK